MTRGVVVVGASAGGVEALQRFVAPLPLVLPASILVVLHGGANPALAGLLTRAGKLDAVLAEDGAAVAPGRIYLAPPGRHLRIRADAMRVESGPRRNHHRPSVDVLFESAAHAFGPRVAAVVLSGSRDDGTAGLIEVKRAGGATLVQDPTETTWPDMPKNALLHAPVDYCLPVLALATKIVELVRGSALPPTSVGPVGEKEEEGPPSVYTCPECSGTLWLERDGSLEKLTCRVGHSYSFQSYLAQQDGALERALWIAYRTLQERLSLQERMARDARSRGREDLARLYDERVRETSEDADLLRRVVYRAIDPGESSASASAS